MRWQWVPAGMLEVPIVADHQNPGLKYYPGGDGKEARIEWTETVGVTLCHSAPLKLPFS